MLTMRHHRYRYAMLALWLAFIAALGPVATLRAETDDEFRRRSERARKIARALERVDAAFRELSEAQAEVPELMDALRREREKLRQIDDDAVEIERKQATFTDMLTTALPWTASLLALGGGYAGGRKHEQRIVRKRGAGAGGGGTSQRDFHSETPNSIASASDQG